MAAADMATTSLGFVVRRCELRGRLDAEYNRALKLTHLKSSYPVARLRDLVTTKTGGTPSKAKPEYWQGNIPWASPKDFGHFYLQDTEDHISRSAVEDSSTSLVPAGTVLIVFRSGVLKHSLPVSITTVETAINQDLKALQVRGEISPEYLGVYFEVFGKRLLPLITKSGATVQSINSEQFEQIEIPVPPNSVQALVVKRLDTAYSTARNEEIEAKKILASIDEFILCRLELPAPIKNETSEKSFFVTTHSELTGKRWDPNYSRHMLKFLQRISHCKYPVNSLKDYIKKAQYGISERATGENSGVPMLRMLNLQDGEWSLQKLKYIALNDEERRPYVLEKGDILFNRTNSKELVGKCAVFDLEEEYVFASYLIRITLDPNKELLPDFVAAYIGSSLGRAQIDAVSRQIAGMTNVNAEEVRDLLIPVPPLDVQLQICQYVSDVRTKARMIRERSKLELDSAKRQIEAVILGQEFEIEH